MFSNARGLPPANDNAARRPQGRTRRQTIEPRAVDAVLAAIKLRGGTLGPATPTVDVTDHPVATWPSTASARVGGRDERGEAADVEVVPSVTDD